MITWQETIMKVGLEDGAPVVILYESEHDVFYVLKKASKQQKGEVLGIDSVK